MATKKPEAIITFTYEGLDRKGKKTKGEMSGKKSIQASFDTANKKKGLFSFLGGSLDTLGKYSEVPTRVGLFKKAEGNKLGSSCNPFQKKITIPIKTAKGTIYLSILINSLISTH